jgi:hypothetical protein
MYMSPAFRKMPVACAEFIAYLEVQYMLSAGTENGKLRARYEDFEKWGMRSDGIKQAIKEAVARGLVEIMKPGLHLGQRRSTPAEYRLTYRPTCEPLANGFLKGEESTDDWKRYKPTTKTAEKPTTKTAEKLAFSPPESGGNMYPAKAGV